MWRLFISRRWCLNRNVICPSEISVLNTNRWYYEYYGILWIFSLLIWRWSMKNYEDSFFRRSLADSLPAYKMRQTLHLSEWIHSNLYRRPPSVDHPENNENVQWAIDMLIHRLSWRWHFYHTALNSFAEAERRKSADELRPTLSLQKKFFSL